MCFRKSKKETEKFRRIILHSSNSHPSDKELAQKYTQNYQKTSKYTILTFFPYALAFQFTKLTNIYFAGMMVLFLLPNISPFSVSSVVSPFAFIMLVSLLREGIEDFRRHKSDWKSNRSRALKIKDGKVHNCYWKELIVGDIVIVQKDERIPADLVILSSEDDDGVAYLETSTLDGEKHLKPRLAPKETQLTSGLELLEDNIVKDMKKNKSFKHNISAVKVDLEAEFYIQRPQASIYKFEGYFTKSEGNKQTSLTAANQIAPVEQSMRKSHPLSIKNFVFKGTKIRNVDWVIGLVVYTGKDTKIQLNGSVSGSKISKLERLMHKMIIVLFLVQVMFSVLSSFGQSMLNSLADSVFSKFFTQVQDTDEDTSTIITILRYFVLLNTMIPISLLVNIEVVRMVAALQIGGNLELNSTERNIKCRVATSSINEELGNIEYVLSDKTGTLTKNKMEMRAFCVGEKIFGGTFVKSKHSNLNFQRNFEGLHSGTTTPGKDTIRRVLEQAELNQDEQFDQELLAIMLSDGRLSEALPIPQLMKGNIQLGALREIKEEDEFELENEGTYDEDNNAYLTSSGGNYKYHSNGENTLDKIKKGFNKSGVICIDEEDEEEKEGLFSEIDSARQNTIESGRKEASAYNIRIKDKIDEGESNFVARKSVQSLSKLNFKKKNKGKLTLGLNKKTQNNFKINIQDSENDSGSNKISKFGKKDSIEMSSTKVTSKVNLNKLGGNTLSVNNKKSKKSGFFGSNNKSNISDIDQEDYRPKSSTQLEGGAEEDISKQFTQAQGLHHKQQSLGLTITKTASGAKSDLNSIFNSPAQISGDAGVMFNFKNQQNKVSLNSINEEPSNFKDNDSLIESVTSNLIEQGLSVDGFADFNDDENIVFLKYQDLIEEYLKCASICHECLVETDDNGKRYFQSSSPDEVAICQRLKEIGVEFQGVRKEKGYVKFFGEKRIFDVEMVFEFDSDRKKQSVVVKEGNQYKLYVKGADSSILPSLKSNIDHPYQELIETHLENFSLLGYRTLVFAMRSLSVQEFENYSEKYSQAMKGINREEDLFNIAQEIETDLILLGSSAVEDSLQDKVKETITRIIGADIKVWMITGDKLETAENIGLMAGIVTLSMKRYYLREITKKNLIEKCNNLKNSMMKLEKHEKSCIIFDMRFVDFVFSRKEDFTKELDTLGSLIMEADALICARSTPKQKAKLVQFVRERGKVCLAIGDGANDVNMIGQANIGVGLYGEEGLQAVQASDFSIANFRYLWKLILVQGRLNHYRISQFILLFFYKNVLYTFPQFIYGFFSYFSGQSLFDDWYLTMYNLLFTAMTVSYIGGCDVDITYWKIMPDQSPGWFTRIRKKFQKKQNGSSSKDSRQIEFARKVSNKEEHEMSWSSKPVDNGVFDESFINCKRLRVRKNIKKRFQDLFYISQKNIYFNIKTFSIELFNALLVTICIVLTTQNVLSRAVLTKDGYTADHWSVSFTIYSSIVMGTNIALLFRCRSITWMVFWLIMLTSIVPYYLFMYWYDRWTWVNLESSYSTHVLFRSYHFYLCVSINCMIVILFEMFQLMKYYRIKPTLAEYFKMLIHVGKEENPIYFQEKAIKAIKKFWNPLARHRAEEKFSTTLNPNDDLDDSGINIFNESQISARKISIIQAGSPALPQNVDKNVSKPKMNFSDRNMSQSMIGDNEFEEIDLGNDEESSKLRNSNPQMRNSQSVTNVNSNSKNKSIITLGTPQATPRNINISTAQNIEERRKKEALRQKFTSMSLENVNEEAEQQHERGLKLNNVGVQGTNEIRKVSTVVEQRNLYEKQISLQLIQTYKEVRNGNLGSSNNFRQNVQH